MPELPEVETMRRELETKVQGRTFLGVWTDTPKLIYHPDNFSVFQKKMQSQKITQVERKGKILILSLESKMVLLFHPKLTGHFLFGNWEYVHRKWRPKLPEQYIHLMFWLSGGKMLAWSDVRKFSRIELWLGSETEKITLLKNIGIDPLSGKLSLVKFRQLITSSKRPIKVVLMDQSLIGGIGNIYANEILWLAKIYPGRKAIDLSLTEITRIYQSMKKILRSAVKLQGTGISDFRDLDNNPGYYISRLKVYQRQGQACPRCGQIIKRMVIGGRSVYYCPECQKEL